MFIELSTYRWREHCGPYYDNKIGYRTETEFKKWKKLDPIARFTSYLINKKLLSKQELLTINTQINEKVDKEFHRVKQSPLPMKPVRIFDVYAE